MVSVPYALQANTANIVKDKDGNTQIQVEESADENIIRFDLDGTEQYRMEQGRLDVRNTRGNVFMGQGSGTNYSNGTGGSNVGFGTATLSSIDSGSANIAIGAAALQSGATGNSNVAVGFRAGQTNSDGSYNIYLGHYAGRFATGSNKLYIENTDINNPLIYGEFDNDLVRINGDLEVTGEIELDRIKDASGDTQMIAASNKIDINLGAFTPFSFTNSKLAMKASIPDFGNDLQLEFKDGSNTNNIANIFPVLSSLPTPGSVDYKMNFTVKGNQTLSTRGDGTLRINDSYTLPALDGTNGQTLVTDGSGILDWKNSAVLADADNDTKIQVEEATDEDIIRIDAGGQELLRIGKNTNNHPYINIEGDDTVNTFIGRGAGQLTTTGIRNTFLGTNVGSANTTGNQNTFVGRNSGQNNTSGYQNTIIGNGTLRDNTTGFGNTALGYLAGSTNVSGDGNVFIGYGAGAQETGGQTLYIDNSDTTEPLIYGNFFTNTLTVNGKGLGNSHWPLTINNSQNPNNGRGNGLRIIAGQNNQNQNSRFISFVTPDGDEIGAIRQNGNNSLNVVTSSDRRLKTNIVDTKFGLNDVKKIDVKDYNFIGEEKPSTGFIAQQLYTIYPEAVSVGGDNPKKDPWAVDYGKVTPLLVKAIQEQQQEIEVLKAENKTLMKLVDKMKQLEERLNKLEND